jgi:TfoX/Sxy family transcriptional regulator of competence genes
MVVFSADTARSYLALIVDGAATVHPRRPVAYDEELANRIRELIGSEPGLTEKKMFGGLAFLFDGRMSVSVSGQGGLLLRVDPDMQEALLERPHTSRFVMREREMRGWMRVAPEALETDEELSDWVSRGVNWAQENPAA